jgi:hypothetical protein
MLGMAKGKNSTNSSANLGFEAKQRGSMDASEYKHVALGI